MEDSTSGSGELVVTRERERERAATSRISNVGGLMRSVFHGPRSEIIAVDSRRAEPGQRVRGEGVNQVSSPFRFLSRQDFNLPNAADCQA